MDVNRLSMWIGLLALALAVPLAVIANLLTPVIRNLYSSTNQNRLRKRLGELTATLQRSESQWTFTAAEWEIYRAYDMIGNFMFVFAHTILTCLFLPAFVFHMLRPQVLPHIVTSAMGVVAAFLVGNLYFFFWRRVIVERTREMHSTEAREELRKEIKYLEAKKGDLLIIQALYGVRELRQYDVTKVLNDAIVGGKLHILVGNHLTGAAGDPCPNIGKNLDVTYTHAGQEKKKIQHETLYLDLP